MDSVDRGADKGQFNVYLPVELIRRTKHKAIDEDTSLSALVERALTDYLTKQDKENR